MSFLVPIPSPVEIKASRSQDSFSIIVTCSPSTFKDVGAFFIYKITATPDSSQVANPIVRYKPYNETSTILTRLDPRKEYSVTVSYVILGQNGEVTGPENNHIQVPPSK